MVSKIDSKHTHLMSQAKCFPFPIKTKLGGGEAIFDGGFSKASVRLPHRKKKHATLKLSLDIYPGTTIPRVLCVFIEHL